MSPLRPLTAEWMDEIGRRHDGLVALPRRSPWVMSKAPGLSLEEVVARAIVEPAKVIGRVPGLGTLKVGAPEASPHSRAASRSMMVRATLVSWSPSPAASAAC
jgi:hypothetical protein